MWMLGSLLCLTGLLAHICCEELFGIVGENFTFPAKIDPKVVDITWNKDKNLVVEREGQNNLKYFGDLQNRAVLQEDGSLTILNLQKSDSGTYELVSWDSVKDHNSKFKLDVLDPLPEPTISCNTSAGVNLVLSCTADFQRPLIYTWELSNEPHSYQGQEHSIPLENADHTVKATCVIKFSQTARSSEISLIQCLPGETGDSSYKRNRGGLIAAVVFSLAAIVTLVFLFRKGRSKRETGRRAAQSSPGNGSGEREQLFHGNSQEQPNSEGAAFSQTVHCENEEPEADRELNEEDRALKDKQTANNGVTQGDTFKKNSSLQANHAADTNEGEVSQDAEGEKGEHMNNSASCSKEDLKS